MSSTPEIVSAADWGMKVEGDLHHVEISARDYFFNHYHGGIPRHDRGVAMAREVQDIHLGNGWAAVGYGFMVGMDGVAFEGRGWENVGAHCPNFNTRGMSVYYARGPGQLLTEEAKATGRWLRDQHLKARGGKPLNTTWHGAHYPTACAGEVIIDWVKAGMPAKSLASSPVVVRPAPVVVKPAVKLNVDGKLGPNTVRALQTRLIAAGFGVGRYGADGSPGRDTTKALQRYLNAKLSGVDLVVDGLGFAQDNQKYKTVAHLQRWLASPIDGRLSLPSSAAVRRMQDRLNRGNF